jgi:hypothetical protein
MQIAYMYSVYGKHVRTGCRFTDKQYSQMITFKTDRAG